MSKWILVTVLAMVLAEGPIDVDRLGRLRQVTDRRAPEEVERLVRQALEDRIAAQDIPDGNLLRNATRVAIREEMPHSALKLGRGALPQLPGFEFYLISEATAQGEADKTGQPVHFITVDLPSIVGDTATISIGLDLVPPREPEVIKLCCCTGSAEFRRLDGRWKFVKWTSTICS
jgi:hypothetical protein